MASKLRPSLGQLSCVRHQRRKSRWAKVVKSNGPCKLAPRVLQIFKYIDLGIYVYLPVSIFLDLTTFRFDF